MNAAVSGDVLARAVTRILPRALANPIPLVAAAALSAALLGAGDARAANTIYVTSSADSGAGSLREAIGLANASTGDTIQFADALKGSTITLTTGDIAISQPMTILGPGPGLLTISGNNQSRIFHVKTNSPNFVDIRDVTLAHGNAGINQGGAIDGLYAAIFLSNVIVAASSTGTGGGGVFVYSGLLKIVDSTISGNHATYGGGIAVNAASLKLYRSTISGNSAATYGGGVYAVYCGSSCYLDIEYSTIRSNVIPDPQGPVNVGGGGIAVASSTAAIQTVTKSTIAYNYAFDGGGGVALLDASTGSHFSLGDATVARNSSAGTAGNGIRVFSGAMANVYHTIVAGNFSAAGASDLAGTFYLTNSLVQAPDSATITPASNGNQLLADPRLGPLGDWGGTTSTMVPAADSPAIDAGGACSINQSDDQRGYERCVNGQRDIGAVERQNPENIIFRDGFNSS